MWLFKMKGSFPFFPYQVRSSAVERACGMVATPYLGRYYLIARVVVLALNLCFQWSSG